MKTLAKNLWDKLGIGLSTLCLIHCLALPLLLVLFPALNMAENEEVFHPILFLFIAMTALMAFLPSGLKHKNFLPLKLAILGLAIVAVGTFLEHTELTEHLVTSAGSILLVAAHLLNLKTGRQHGQHCAHC